MPTNGWFIVLVLVFFICLMTWAIRLRRTVKRRTTNETKSSASSDAVRCQCGYDVSHLELARCPECGRVIGFNSTAEQLGLTQHELRLIAERHRARADDVDVRPG